MTNIPNPIAASTRARPDHTAIVYMGASYTYKELLLMVRQYAASLQEKGVTEGDTVGLLGQASIEWVVALHSIGWLGAIAAPIPNDSTKQDRENIEGKLSLSHTIDTDSLSLSSISEISKASLPNELDWSLDSVRLKVLSSGSTGSAKIAVITTSQLLFSAMGSAIRLGHDTSDVWLNCLPLHHIGGLSVLYRCGWYATTVELHRGFNKEAVSKAIGNGASMVSLVPTMLVDLLDFREDETLPEGLRVVLLGGAAASNDLLDRCKRLHLPVAQSWGMTEAASQIATSMAGDFSDGVGPPLCFAKVTSTGGRLTVAGPLVATEIQTTDIGHIDEAGRVHIYGRSDSVINSGGKKINPREIEEILTAAPYIKEAAVVGVTDARWGEAVAAAIVTLDEHENDLEEFRRLDKWCAEHLARWKRPKKWVRVPALPKTSLGKLRHGAIRDLFKGIQER
jgi:o-succinylbenzoate---CoA ligase